MIATLAPSLGGRERRALAGEPGPDDQDVVCWHGLCSVGYVGNGRRGAHDS